MRKMRSLKSNVNTIIIAILCIIFAVQAVYLFYINSLILIQKKKDIDNVTYQIKYNINGKLEVLQQTQKSLASTSYLQDFLSTDSEQTKNKLKYDLVDFISNIQNFNVDMIYMMVFDEENNAYSFTNNIITEEYNKIIDSYQEYISTENAKDNFYYMFFTIDNSSYQETYMCCFTPVQITDYVNVKKNRIGTAVVCSKVNMTRLSLEIERWKNIELFLFNGQKEITLLNSYIDEDGIGKTVVNEIDIPNTSWKVKGTLRVSEMENILKFIRYLMLLEFIIIIILLFVMQVVFSKMITNPIHKVISYLDNYYLTERKEKLNIPGNTEISMILKHINIMLSKVESITRKIVNTQQKLYETELGEKKAVLYALQSQINPHFLYNTLECIRSIAFVHNISDIVEISTSISDIMRYTIKGDGHVLVRDEIDIIEKYLTIMKVRYPNRFETQIDVSEEILNKSIVKMILQPIVENAFNHGLFANNNKGKLIIKGYEENDCLFFSIRDNGAGIEHDKYISILEKINEDKEEWDTEDGIGLVNINNRVKINYGTQYGLEILSEEGKFTQITVRLPN